MFDSIVGLLKRDGTRDQVEKALAAGVGLYHSSWQIGKAAPAVLAQRVAGWCREALSRTHRPYGLDHATVSLALVADDGDEITVETYKVLRPVDFYGACPAEATFEATLAEWDRQGLLASSPRISIALFSWGDLTRELLAAG